MAEKTRRHQQFRGEFQGSSLCISTGKWSKSICIGTSANGQNMQSANDKASSSGPPLTHSSACLNLLFGITTEPLCHKSNCSSDNGIKNGHQKKGFNQTITLVYYIHCYLDAMRNRGKTVRNRCQKRNCCCQKSNCFYDKLEQGCLVYSRVTE